MVKPLNPPPYSAVPVYPVPPRSGNEINGLGIREKIRARHVFHTNPAYGPHAWMLLNRFFTSLSTWATVTGRMRVVWWMRRGVGPAAPTKRPVSDPVAMAAEVKDKAKGFGAAVVGITRLTEMAQYEHANLPYPTAICIGIPMDRTEMATVPQPRSAAEVMKVYGDVARCVVLLAEWIRAQGWQAKAYGDSQSTDILQIPLAIEAGLGTLGKHGSIIGKEFGSNYRLGTVVTDMPLALDAPVDIGVEDLCATCRRCTIDCPADAISDRKQWVRGEEKWYVDFDKCAPYFSITGGCAICIEVCPWSEEGRGELLSQTLLKKRAAKARQPVAAE